MNVLIPKGEFDSPAPCWIATERYDNHEPCKPIIKCNCGKVCGIGAHHVHADGIVTASFYHAHSSTGLKYSTDEGCGWHVFLALIDYDQGDFPPNVDEDALPTDAVVNDQNAPK